jgi:hypothetical protein
MYEREGERESRERERELCQEVLDNGGPRASHAELYCTAMLILIIAMNVDSVYCFKVLQGSL